VNYSVVGAFVLVLGAVLIAGVLWLASGGAWQNSYDFYLAILDDISRRSQPECARQIQRVDVGNVRDIELDRVNPQRVKLLFAIEHGTPIKEDTIAVLKTQGLTGIAYVELSGRSGFTPLRAVAGKPVSEIPPVPTFAQRRELENVLTVVLAKMDSSRTTQFRIPQ